MDRIKIKQVCVEVELNELGSLWQLFQLFEMQLQQMQELAAKMESVITPDRSSLRL